MKNLIWIETDCPYFPGKNGHSFFLIREYLKHGSLAVIAPTYPHQPKQGILNLRRSVPDCYLWPEPKEVDKTGWPPYDFQWRLRRLFLRLPRKIREWLLFRLLGFPSVDHEEYTRLAILSNLAPYVWMALRKGFQNGIILVQSSISSWLDWMPEHPAKMFYLHDVKTDYLSKKIPYCRTLLEQRQNFVEMKTAIAQETKISNEAEMAFFVSKLDRERYQTLFGLPDERCAVVPIPVDGEYFTAKERTKKKRQVFQLLFTGHLTHPPNVDALRYFLAEIWGQLKSKNAGLRLIVAGCYPAPSLAALLQEDPAITFHPNIPDVRELFRQADIFIVPMRFGGGVRQKILEAMLMELPVVSSVMGMEGIDLPPNITTVHTATSADEFAQKILYLKENRPSVRELKRGRDFVLQNHSLEKSGDSLSKAINKAFSIRKKAPFRVLFDLRWMKAGLGGGIEQLARSLTEEIERIDYRNEYRIFAPDKTLPEFAFLKGSRFSRVSAEFPMGYLFPLWASTGRSLIDSLGKHHVLTAEMLHGRYLRRLSFDMIHSIPAYIHPEFIGFPNILTFTDLQHLSYPQFFTQQENEERNRLYKTSVDVASKILCISDFTRNDLQKRWQVPAQKLETVHLAASKLVRLAERSIDRKGTLARFRIPSLFLFYPAHLWPHKNHAELLSAFDIVRKEWKQAVHLVVTVERETFWNKHGTLVEERGLARNVICTGYVSELELAALYQEAAMLVFPSLFEGFGMPVLEAMHFGCPVVCSNTTSLPEIAGTAARYFDPTSKSEIAEAILDVLQSGELRRHLVEEGHKRKAQFSWRRSALKTLFCYQEVHEHRCS